jgi:dipeptidyl aminopeptidase/acylaminoacyl peptidase
MRQQRYPGSELVVEETLAPGSNYERYIASYQSEGNKVYALLTVPRGAKPATGWPVIIFNHGFIQPTLYRTTERYVAYVDWLARSGYIVLRSDYRGHGNSEGQASNGSATPDYTVDVLNAMASVKGHPDADPQRIGFWGHSMGGQLTLRAMVTVKDIKAGVIWAGNVEAYPDLARDAPKGNGANPPVPTYLRGFVQELITQYGAPEQNPNFWHSISPNSYLADLSGPVQLHHGTADESVPFPHSEHLFAQIKAANKPVEFYAYAGNDHNLAQSFATAMQRTIVFFDRYVKGQ